MLIKQLPAMASTETLEMCALIAVAENCCKSKFNAPRNKSD